MRKSKLGSKWLALASLILAGVFLVWIWTSILPMLTVELKYQYKTWLKQTLHKDSLAELFIPNFSGLDLRSRSKNQEYGIVIPAIYLDEPVIFNVDPNNKNAYTTALKQGIAHASGTSFPDDSGLGYYFAHSSSAELSRQFNAVFYLLGKLQTGDDVYIWHEQAKFHYQVASTQVVPAHEVGFLTQNYHPETIVLQTCWPPGTTRERLLVFAKRVE